LRLIGARGRLQVSVDEDGADPGAGIHGGQFQFDRVESRQITVVRTVPSTTSSTTAITSGATSAPIANTGVPAADRQVGWALALLGAGAALVVAGAPRRRRH
jgi:hypothetical protein